LKSGTGIKKRKGCRIHAASPQGRSGQPFYGWYNAKDFWEAVSTAFPDLWFQLAEAGGEVSTLKRADQILEARPNQR
jgi:hypothetical protein